MTEELLNGGLVMSEDPGFLEPGSLVRTENATYRHDDDALLRYPGVQEMASIASGQAINGIQTCHFASAHWLVAQCGGAYFVGDAESDAPTMASALAVASGQPIQAITHTNRWFILNGVQPNQALSSAGTFRHMGMISVTQSPVLQSFAASSFSASSTGYYDYWYTEVYDDKAGTVLESSSNGVTTVSISATATQAPVFRLGPPVNPLTTSYLLYRSPKKVNSGDAGYPTGFVVGEVSLGSPATFMDTAAATQSTTLTYPGLWNYATGGGFTITATGAGSPGVKVTANAIASAIQATGGATTWYGIAGSQINWGVSQPNQWPTNGQITVTYSACVSASGAGASGNTDWVDVRLVPGIIDATQSIFTTWSGVLNSPTTFVLQADGSWKPTNPLLSYQWPAYFTSVIPAASITPVAATANINMPNLPQTPVMPTLDGTFCILAIASASATSHSPATVVTIQNIEVQANYIGGAITSGNAYPTITFTIGSASDLAAVNDPPPIASCGCVFDGQVVTNDVNNPRSIRYSMGDEPEAWPSLYEIDLPIKDNDVITAMAAINGVLVVGTKGSIWTIQYLPNEADASINRGIVSRQLSDKHNILGPTCITQFLNVRGQPELAFVGTNGIFSTDGGSITELGRDIVWTAPPGYPSLVGPLTSSIYTSILSLTNDIATRNLRLFVVTPTGDTQVWSTNYSQRHMKPTHLWGVYGTKWSGPVHVSKYSPGGARTPLSCAHGYKRNSGLYITLHGRGSAGGWSGSIAREDGEDVSSYAPLPDSANNYFSFQTRDMYLAGRGKQFQVGDVWIYGDRQSGTATGTPIGVITMTQKFVNGNDITVPGDILTAPYTTKLISVPVGNVNADGLSFKFQASTSDYYNVHAIILDAEDGGDSKRA